MESPVGSMRLFTSAGDYNLCKTLKNLEDVCKSVVSGPVTWEGPPAYDDESCSIGGLADMFYEIEKDDANVAELIVPSCARKTINFYGDSHDHDTGTFWRAKVVYDDHTPNEVRLITVDGVALVGKWQKTCDERVGE